MRAEAGAVTACLAPAVGRAEPAREAGPDRRPCEGRKCVAIMQPTYLPWSGYFHLMASVDAFVLLDDVQFQRRSWHTRNRILLQGREHLLTVPVAEAHQAMRLDAVQTVADAWRDKHWATLTQAYAKAPHGRPLLALLEPHYRDREPVSLVVWNRALINALAGALGIDTPCVAASELACAGQRSEHLLALCRALGATDYLSPQGSRDYLVEDRFEANGEVALRFQSFEPQPYAQARSPGFVSHLSVIDVMAQHGFAAAARYVRGLPMETTP